MKILLAEDDFATRKFMSKFLEQYGDCDIAVDGMEAVDAFLMALESDEGYDLVCLDVMMPVMGGLEAAKNIRKMDRPDAKTVAIIAMSANAFHDDVEQSLAAGMNVHMAKPLDFDKLLATIKEYCDKN